MCHTSVNYGVLFVHSKVHFFTVLENMDKLFLFVIVAALLVATAIAYPRNIPKSGNVSPKYCKTRCDRKLEYCDATCTMRFGEGRTGEDPFYYKRCLDDCAMEYLYSCLSDCWTYIICVLAIKYSQDLRKWFLRACLDF